MASMPNVLRALLLSAAVASATPATGSIFARDDICAAQNLLACSSDLPSGFCCSKESVCVPLAGSTTVLCCPTGQTCKQIQPITCNINEQDPKKNPSAPIKTSVFDVPLESCGSGTCCPYGFSCTSNNRCQKDEDQSNAPAQQSSSSSTTAQPSATSTQNESSTSTSAAAASATPTESKGSSSSHTDSSSNPKMTSIIGGVIGGCLVLVILAVVIFLCIRRRRRTSGYAGSSGAGTFGTVISEPIIQPNSYRTDFIRKPPSNLTSNRSSHHSSNRSSMTEIVDEQSPLSKVAPRISIPNPFDSPNLSSRSPVPSRASYASRDDQIARKGSVARLAPIRAMKASSSYSSRPSMRNADREPSSESINVFADPSDVGSERELEKRHTRGTTFTDMMDEAELGDVRRGRPYVAGTTPRL